ncbi:MAG: MFS transporter [Dehalococcoidia bacterium]
MSPSPATADHPLMRRNLRLLPWWWVLRWAWFGEGIWVIYLTDERGLTLGEALIFEAVFSAVVIATELPTGMIADRFGRRISLLIGTVSVVFAFLAFGTSSALWVLLASYAFFAAAETSFSGADSAMLYDTLKAAGRERDFTVYYGRLNALIMTSLAGFTVIGAVMVNWVPLWVPFVLSAIATLPAVVLAWRFTEPPRTEERHAYLETGRRAIALTARTPSLFWVMILMTATTTAIASMGVFQQPFLRDAGIPLWGIGVGVSLQMGVGAVGSWMADRAGRWIGIARVFWLMPIASALALLAAVPGTAWLFPLFIFPSIGWNVMYPHFAEYLARRTPEAVRASVISVSNLISGGVSVVVVPFVALGVDHLGFRPTIALLAATLAAVIAVAYLGWRRAGGHGPLDEEGPHDEQAGSQSGVDAPDPPPVPSRSTV